MDLKSFCDMIPDCFVTGDNSTWACESAMDICRAIDDEAACGANDLCTFGENGCLPTEITWSPLDVAANWLAAVNTGVDACEDVSNLFQSDENAKDSPPLLLVHQANVSLFLGDRQQWVGGGTGTWVRRVQQSCLASTGNEGK